MDVNKFMTEYQRMCASYTGCRDCPLYTDNEQCTEIPSCFTKEFTDKVIKIVEDWSAAHPRKTRQSIFLEQWPNAQCIDGILVLCPGWIDTCFSCPIYGNNNVDCATCRHEFWMQEVE